MKVDLECIGPELTFFVNKENKINEAIKFGNVQVLKPHSKLLILKNISPICANYNLNLQKKNFIISLQSNSGTIEPNGKKEIIVQAYTPDNMKFKDTLVVNVSEGMFLLKKNILCKHFE